MPESKRTLAIESIGGDFNLFKADHEDWLTIKRALWKRQRFSIVTEEHGEYFFCHISSAQFTSRTVPSIPVIKAVLLSRE